MTDEPGQFGKPLWGSPGGGGIGSWFGALGGGRVGLVLGAF